MAMVVQIGADVSGAIAGLKRFEQELSGNAVGSINQLRKAAALLKNELANLTPTQLNAPFGKGLTNALQTVNAELKSLEKQAAVTGQVAVNSFSKAYGSVRTLANILPGLGISTIFLFAFQGAEKLVQEIFNINRSLTSAQVSAKAFSEAFREATKSSGSELSKLQALVGIAQDVTQSTQRRKNAIQELQKEYPDYLRNINLENINSAAAAKAIDDLTQSIFQKALADALANKVAEKQVELIDASKKAQKELAALGRSSAGTSQIGGIRFNEQAIFTGRAKSALAEVQKIKDEIADIQKLAQDALAQGLDFTKTPKNNLKKSVEDAFKESDILIKARLQPIPPLESDVDEVLKAAQKAFEERAKNLPQIGQTSAQKLLAAQLKDFDSQRQEALKKFREDAEETAKAISSAFGDAFSSIVDAVKNGQSVASAFFNSMINAIQQTIAKLIQAQLEALIFRILVGGATNIPGIGGGLHAAPHAAGGQVGAGSLNLIGERGPELFVPRQNGRIIPNNQLSGVVGAAGGQQYEERLVASIHGSSLDLVLQRFLKSQARNG